MGRYRRTAIVYVNTSVHSYLLLGIETHPQISNATLYDYQRHTVLVLSPVIRPALACGHQRTHSQDP